MRSVGSTCLTILLLSLSLVFAGCMATEPVPEDRTVEMTAIAAVELGIEDGSLLDLEAMVTAEERFAMRVREVTGSIQANATFAYDRTTNLSSIGLIYASPYQSVSFTIIEGGETYAIERDGNWSVGRDLAPSFHDPFSFQRIVEDEHTTSAISMPAAELPVDVNDLRTLDWSVSHDGASGQLVAMASNESATIILEFLSGSDGLRLVSIEAFGNDDAYTRIVSFERGEQVAIVLPDDSPRMAFPLLMDRAAASGLDGTTTLHGEVSSAFRWEVAASDVTMEVVAAVGNGTEVVASLHLTAGSVDLLDGNGSTWNLSWMDSDGDGLVGAGDGYEVSTDSNRSFDVRFHDAWADGYALDPLPAPGAVTSLLALASALAIRRSDRHGLRSSAGE